MLVLLSFCGWIITPKIRVVEFLALIFLVYVAISSLIAVCEIAVVDDGLIIDRLILPERFVPWGAVNRVHVYAHDNGDVNTAIEITSISFHEGLSPLNRLPGLVYGQGFRQTIVITPDAIENYEQLLVALEEHCVVIWHQTQPAQN